MNKFTNTSTNHIFCREIYQIYLFILETARFHLALRMVGTDFSLMETIFRHRKRTELKRKFKSEEKCNPELIEKAISNQIPFNLEQLREEGDYFCYIIF